MWELWLKRGNIFDKPQGNIFLTEFNANIICCLVQPHCHVVALLSGSCLIVMFLSRSRLVV
jgi:hypothetical protein